jgi:hypothetical protein
MGRAFIGLNDGAFALRTSPLTGEEDYFKASAVTDSKLLLLYRSLGATSPRFNVENLQGIIADRFDPKGMRDFGILRDKSEIELFLGQKHFRLRRCLSHQQEDTDHNRGRYQICSHKFPPISESSVYYIAIRLKSFPITVNDPQLTNQI